MSFFFSVAPKIKVPARFRDTVASFSKGETVKLKIPVTGYPKPTSSWTVDGRRVNRGVEDAERHAVLTIPNAERKDSGEYELTAENEVGSDSAVIHICINGKTQNSAGI